MKRLRARYRSGHIRGRRVSDYARERGVNPERKTDTFAQVTLWVDNERWKDVPFVLRTGKAMDRDRMEICVYFENMQSYGECSSLRERSYVLRFDLAKEEQNLDLVNIKGDRGLKGQSMGMDARMSPQPLPSYGRLFLEVMSGNSLLFMRDDEMEEMWRIIQPIADAWEENVVPLQIYRASSKGPVLKERALSTS